MRMACLKNLASIAPNGGVNFQPRHLDFHPTQPWVFLSLERQTAVAGLPHDQGRIAGCAAVVHQRQRGEPREEGSRCKIRARFMCIRTASSCIRPRARRARTRAEKRFSAEARTASRCGRSIRRRASRRCFKTPTRGAQSREHLRSTPARGCWWWGIRPRYRETPANLAVFRVRTDGKLDFVRKYDVDTSSGSLFWMGIVPLP